MEIHEEVESLNGTKVRRVKSSLIYGLGWTCLIVGIILVVNEIMIGGTLILFLFPCLMIYPFVRYMFGGKDSVVGVVTTVVVEEVLKNEIKKIGKKDKRGY
jgi:hypothetical protein